MLKNRFDQLMPENHPAELDSPWKHVLKHFFQFFMEFCLSELAVPIDWSKGYETLDKELQKIVPASQTGKRLSDLLFKVWLKNGEEKWILIHLEIQGQKRDDFPHRMFVYNYRTYDQYKKPVVSIALLLDADPEWRPDFFEMTSPLSEKESEPYLQFRYHVIKLIDYAARKQELYERKDLFAKVILAQLVVMETRKNVASRVPSKLALVKELLKLGLTNDQTRELYKFIDWVMIIPEDLMLTYNEQLKEIADENDEWNIPYVSTAERVGMIKGSRLFLERQIKHRFPRDAEKFLHLINDADSNTLSMWGEKLMDAKTIEDVFVY